MTRYNLSVWSIRIYRYEFKVRQEVIGMKITFLFVSISDGDTTGDLSIPKSSWEWIQFIIGVIGTGLTCYQIFFSG